MRTLQRMPAHYRAALTIDERLTLPCVTRDLHAEGALLHVVEGVPEQVGVGTAAQLRIELAVGAPLDIDVDVRHFGEHRLGVRFRN